VNLQPRTNIKGKIVTAVPDANFKPIITQMELPDMPGICEFADRYDGDPDAHGELVPRGVVVHHTATHHTQATIDFFKKNLVDVHFIVGHDGEIVQMAPLNRKCAHAGISEWNGYKNLNSHFVGIELVNIGPLTKDKAGNLRDCYGLTWHGPVRERKMLGYEFWEPATEAQEQALFHLLTWLHTEHKIEIANMCMHYEASPGRKVDPAGALSLGGGPELRAAIEAAMMVTP
jgi:N-acetylmuramoyl-L-alanine amidase